jgi:HAD superfamily hydrolase (TIGR01509 family)
MYQELLKQLPDTKPEEVIFIDDQEKCLVPARAMGINTVLAKNAGQIINDVSKLLAD